MKRIEQFLTSIARVFIALNLIGILSLIFSLSDLLTPITDPGSYIIIWPSRLNLDLGTWLIVIFLYYFLLFFVPVFGLLKLSDDLKKINTWLLLLNIVNLSLLIGFIYNFALRPIA